MNAAIEQRLTHPVALLALPALAFWPVWQWYGARVLDPSDEPWCLLALATTVYILIRRGAPRPNLAAATALVLLYAAAVHVAPPLVRSLIAFAAIGCLWNPRVIGLLLLSTPLLPSLQFYLGYPLRLIVAEASALLLQLGGLAVSAQGILLRYGDALVEVDAPCSGVRMLWTGLYVAAALIAFHRMKPRSALLCLTGTGVVILLANVFRAAALFYLEAGILPADTLPAWLHDAVGLLVFSMAIWVIAWQANQVRERCL